MSFGSKTQEAMLIVVFLTRLWPSLASLLLDIVTSLRLTLLFIFAGNLVLEIGADIVDSAVKLVKNKRHTAVVGG